MSAARAIPTRSRIRAAKSRARDAALRRLGPDLLEHVLTFVNETCDARAACVARDWAQTRRAWSVDKRDCDISTTSFAPNGRLVAVAGQLLENGLASGGAVACFDVLTGRLIWSRQDPKVVEGCEFSSDSSLCAVAWNDEQIQLRDAATGEWRGSLSYAGPLLDFSGATLAVAGGTTASIALIDWASGEVRVVVEHGDVPQSIALTGVGGSTLAVCDSGASNGEEIVFYNAATGDELRKFALKGYDAPFSHTDVIFSDDGTKFAEYHAFGSIEDMMVESISGERLVVRDALTGAVLWQTESFYHAERKTPVLEFSSDSSTLLGPSSDLYSIASYDADTGELRRELKLSREPGVPVLSSGGSLLAVSGGKLAYRHHRLTLHDAATGALRRKAR